MGTPQWESRTSNTTLSTINTILLLLLLLLTSAPAVSQQVCGHYNFLCLILILIAILTICDVLLCMIFTKGYITLESEYHYFSSSPYGIINISDSPRYQFTTNIHVHCRTSNRRLVAGSCKLTISSSNIIIIFIELKVPDLFLKFELSWFH